MNTHVIDVLDLDQKLAGPVLDFFAICLLADNKEVERFWIDQSGQVVYLLLDVCSTGVCLESNA